MSYVRTDLALESMNFYIETSGELSGIESTEKEIEGIKITNVQIKDDKTAEALGKKCGRYITIEFPNPAQANPETHEKTAQLLAEELDKLIGNDRNNVLIVGLGNEKITPDALGPKTVEALLVTRHIFEYMPKGTAEGLGSVCAVSPGVLGITGIETGEIIKGVCERVKPSLVIAIDALASRSPKRVSTTIQISDTGINPGSGVGNNRKSLDRETLGVPVIAIGVPMVCDSATIAADAIDKAIEVLTGNSEKENEAFEKQKERILTEFNAEKTGKSIVTPKEIDTIIMRTSKILANGINYSMHKGISHEEINALIN